MSVEVRETLDQLIRRRGESYAGLSQLLGRNPAYIQQYVKRGSPRRLEEQDRRILARYLDVDEVVLGAEPRVEPDGQAMARVPRLAVQASAGPGSLVDGEVAVGAYWFDRAWLRRVSRGRPDELSIIAVAGDSMAPTLSDGDDALVDGSDAADRLRDGVYVLRRDDTLMVKRLTLAPVPGRVTISSDNPAYPTFHDCPLEGVAVVGRVVWIGRKLA